MESMKNEQCSVGRIGCRVKGYKYYVVYEVIDSKAGVIGKGVSEVGLKKIITSKSEIDEISNRIVEDVILKGGAVGEEEIEAAKKNVNVIIVNYILMGEIEDESEG